MNYLDETDECFGNKALAELWITLAAKQLEIENGQPDSPVIPRIEDDGKFDPVAYQIYRISQNRDLKADAKRSLVVTIAGHIGSGMSEGESYAAIEDSIKFQALAPKRPAKVHAHLWETAHAWIYYKNCIKVFYDLLCWTYEGMQSKRLQKDSKAQHPCILTLVALHQLKDNDSRGLVAFRYISRLRSYLTRIDVVSPSLSTLLEPKHLGRKFEAYAKLGHITYAKGVQGGIASRAGLLPYENTITTEQLQEAAAHILASFEDTSIHAELADVLTYVADNGMPRYNDSELENLVETLRTAFVPYTRKAADDRIAERHIETVEFNEERIKAELELTASVTAHLDSGEGFQATFKAFERPVEPLLINPGTSLRVGALIAKEKLSRLPRPTATAPKTRYASITQGLRF